MKPRLTAWIDWFRAHPTTFQFGQKDDQSTFNGSTGCTHSDVQALEWAIHGCYRSQDEISTLAGYPWPHDNPARRGMRASTNPNEELNLVLRKLALPYEVRFFSRMTDSLWTWLCQRSNDGPIIAAVDYPWLPRNRSKGAGLNGIAEVGGATQVGLSGGHAAFWLGYDKRTDMHGNDKKPVARWHHWWHDPDHASPARPEKPAYDRFLATQGKTAIESIQRVLVNGAPRAIMVVVPTKPVDPK